MTNGNLTNGNWKQMANGERQVSIKHVPIDVVDKLADELVVEYSNPSWRPWYCGVINQFGIDQVTIWRGRCKSAISPARLFSHYVKQARLEVNAEIETTPGIDEKSTEDKAYIPTDEELTDQAIAIELDHAFKQFELGKPENEAVPWLNEDSHDNNRPGI